MVHPRLLTTDDLPSCVALYLSVYNAPPWNERWQPGQAERRLRDIHDTPGSFGLVAADDTDGGAVVGFVLGYAQQWEGYRHFYVKEMCVRTDRQRRGVGTTLMRALVDPLKGLGVRHVYLLTARGGPAQAFYGKCGFRASDDVVPMALDLT